MSSYINFSNNKHLFCIEDFDAPASTHVPIRDSAMESIDKEDLELCRLSAWNEGFAAGRGEKLAADNASIGQYLQSINAEIVDFREVVLEQCEQAADGLAEIIMSVIGTAFPILSVKFGVAEIAAVAAEILPNLMRDQKITIRVAPERMGILKRTISKYNSELLDNIRLDSSKNLGGSDIAICWEYGEAVRDLDAIWRKMQTILAPLGLTPEPTTDNSLSKEAADEQ